MPLFLQDEWDLFQLFDYQIEFVIYWISFHWIMMESGLILNTLMNYKCDGLILTIYEMKWYLYYVLLSYVRLWCNVMWCYMHI